MEVDRRFVPVAARLVLDFDGKSCKSEKEKAVRETSVRQSRRGLSTDLRCPLEESSAPYDDAQHGSREKYREKLTDLQL